jgi:hypothetical protein
MLMTGGKYLESIRDGRRVYLGSEPGGRRDHPSAFRNAAQTLATIYDRKRAPENREVMTCEGDGETFSGPTTAVPERQYQEFAASAGNPGPCPPAGAPGTIVGVIARTGLLGAIRASLTREIEVSSPRPVFASSSGCGDWWRFSCHQPHPHFRLLSGTTLRCPLHEFWASGLEDFSRLGRESLTSFAGVATARNHSLSDVEANYPASSSPR